VVLPIVGVMETGKPLPNTITESVLGKGAAVPQRR
jgi:hypothetical protein